jgi:hypothetical protein
MSSDQREGYLFFDRFLLFVLGISAFDNVARAPRSTCDNTFTPRVHHASTRVDQAAT